MKQQIIELAYSQLGVKQSATDVKYNHEYYGRPSTLAWCCVFIWWLFKHIGHPELFYGGKKTAWVPTLLSYHKQQWVAFDKIEPGDIVFFNFKGKKSAQHVGICVATSDTHVSTIDGNTNGQGSANGGAVALRSRVRSYIIGAYRPKYQDPEPEEVEEVYNTIEQVPAWYREAVKWAVGMKYIVGNEKGELALTETKAWMLQVLFNIEHTLLDEALEDYQ